MHKKEETNALIWFGFTHSVLVMQGTQSRVGFVFFFRIFFVFVFVLLFGVLLCVTVLAVLVLSFYFFVFFFLTAQFVWFSYEPLSLSPSPFVPIFFPTPFLFWLIFTSFMLFFILFKSFCFYLCLFLVILFFLLFFFHIDLLISYKGFLVNSMYVLLFPFCAGLCSAIDGGLLFLFSFFLFLPFFFVICRRKKIINTSHGFLVLRIPFSYIPSSPLPKVSFPLFGTKPIIFY